MRLSFYSLDSQTAYQSVSPLDDLYSIKLWKPALRKIVPSGSPARVSAWWFMHYLHVFSNRDYSLLLIKRDDAIVHRSVVSPRYFRFPFMAPNDLQIGDTWTVPEYRGKGLATIAVTHTIQALSKPGRLFWYVTEESNLASIRVIEKAGFKKVGEGSRTKRFGHSAFGAFVIDKVQMKE